MSEGDGTDIMLLPIVLLTPPGRGMIGVCGPMLHERKNLIPEQS